MTVAIPAHLAGVFDAFVLLEGCPLDHLVRGILCVTLAEAERDPRIQAALRASRRGRLHLVGTRPSTSEIGHNPRAALASKRLPRDGPPVGRSRWGREALAPVWPLGRGYGGGRRRPPRDQ